MLTIGIIALIHPIQLSNLALPLTAGIFVVGSIIFVYMRTRDGNINKQDGMILIGAYAFFVVLQYLLEALSF
jgi:Ca2+/Na+ antiporter